MTSPFKALRLPFLLLVLVALPGGAPPAAQAHTSSITRVGLFVEPTSLRLDLQLNAPDLLRNVLGDSLGRTRFESPGQLEAASDRIRAYVTRRVRMEWDGAPAEPATVTGPTLLDPRGADAAPGMSDGAPPPQAISLSVDVPLPAGARRLGLTLNLYREDDFKALFDIASHRGDGAAVRNDYVAAGTRIELDLAREDLDDAGAPAFAAADAGTDPPAAHGSRAPLGRTIRQFLVLGFTHILPHGLDHILFVLGLFLLTPRWRPLLKQVTAFTLAHSLTLGLAMLGIVRLPSSIIEPLIALSIAFVAVENMIYTEARPGRWAFVFAFGLVHGLGFASVLAELGIPDGRFVPALVSFNLGVEAGQMAVITAAWLLVLPLRNRGVYRRWVAVPASVAIAVTGVVWAVERVLPTLGR